MSDPEDFISRWSRRKRDEAAVAGTAAKPQPGRDLGPASDVSASPNAGATAPPPFDPARLPSLDSIGAATDIRAFLAAGVPADLARAALRRAWSADPAIRDFVGLSENSWDFNAPNGIPGFGPIDPADLGRLVAQITGTPEADPAVDHSGPPATPAQAAQPMAQPSESGRIARAGDEPADPGKELRMPDGGATTGSGEVKQCTEKHVAVRTQSEPAEDRAPLPRRNHGGALPE